jgi:hypothetical protein
MSATTRARVRRSPDEMRAALIELGLREEEKPIEGYAFSYGKHPDHAMSFYKETHGGAEATRFYCGQRSFTLSD